jgi:hypothetical protein
MRMAHHRAPRELALVPLELRRLAASEPDRVQSLLVCELAHGDLGHEGVVGQEEKAPDGRNLVDYRFGSANRG